jgi:O-antigen/teichoic acid export membrane protein
MTNRPQLLSEKDFKKDYLAYFLGIIVPAGINFLTIPFFKHVLGAANFGVFSFYFSILIVISTSFAGGITQSVIRLHIEYSNIKEFFVHSLWLTILSQLIITLPFAVYIQYNLHVNAFTVLFTVSLFFANVYITLMAITQANRLSKLSAVSETIRTVLMFGISIFILHFFPSVYFLNAIFISLVSSYGISAVFLFLFNNFSIKKMIAEFDFKKVRNIGIEISKYGGFLIGWYFFSFGISLANRFILAHFIGKEGIGDYTASFDIINKSITVVLAPVVVSLFPIMIKANLQGSEFGLSGFIMKLTLIETGLMLICIAAFVFFGFQVLSYMLKTPPSGTYLFLDVQVIAGSFIWQIAMLQHKFLELKKSTGHMLLFVAIAFFASIIVDIYLISNYGISYASTGFLVGGLVYIGCISYFKNKGSIPYFLSLSSVIRTKR